MSFDRLPDELLVAIISRVPSLDLAVRVQRINRRFHRLASEPMLWYRHCCADFRYWNEEAGAKLRFAKYHPLSETDWKKMWTDRMRDDAIAAVHFECVLASKVDRVSHLGSICSRELDAMDFLMRQYRFADQQALAALEAAERGLPPPAISVDDYLARRYYAHLALSSINRSRAVREWIHVRSQEDPLERLDRAVAAFEMFALHGDGNNIEYVQELLDNLANDFERAHAAHLGRMTVRDKAHALLAWLRSQGLLGIRRPEHNYRNMRNCLLGQALINGQGPASLPLIASTIFACVAQRLGLQAHCVSLPGSVQATVLAQEGFTVDDTPLDAAADDVAWHGASHDARVYGPLTHALPNTGDRLFLDPYQDSQEVPVHELRRGLEAMSAGLGTPIQVRVAAEAAAGAEAGGGRHNGNGDGDSGINGGGLPMRVHLDTHLLPAPTVAIVQRLANNIEASWAHAQQVTEDEAREVMYLHRPVSPYLLSNNDLFNMRYRCGSFGDPKADMEKLTYGSAWATMLMWPTASGDWEQHLARLLGRFAHGYNEDAWLLNKYLLPIHDEYIRTAMERNQRRWHAVAGGGMAMPFGNPAMRARVNAWTHVRNLLQMVENLDRRKPHVSRRYTQDLCERVRFKVGQVMRHRRFGFIAIIDGWTPEDPTEMPGPRTAVDNVETAAAAAEDGAGDAEPARAAPMPTPSPDSARKQPYYSCLQSGSERRIVAQHNIELVTDWRLIPAELMFLAGKHFKRLDYATCTFVSNLAEFYPDD